MRTTGTSTPAADREVVWRPLHDSAVMVRTIPSCHRLEAPSEDADAEVTLQGAAMAAGAAVGAWISGPGGRW